MQARTPTAGWNRRIRESPTRSRRGRPSSGLPRTGAASQHPGKRVTGRPVLKGDGDPTPVNITSPESLCPGVKP